MGKGEIGFEDPRAVLGRHGLRPKRSWGQNFLISERAVRVIADECVDAPGRLVVEIGAGLGTLTRVLLERGARVVAVERDREMCEVLRRELGGYGGFTLEEADAKRFDYAGVLGADGGVVTGNLPYQLTGQLLMVQREVGERLLAGCGDRARGALTVMAGARFEASKILGLPPTAFVPRPKVRSTVIALRSRGRGAAGAGIDLAVFDRVVKAAFSVRRKTLRNSLVAGGLGAQREVDALLERAGVEPRKRPQQLEEAEFEAIARLI